MDPVGAVLAVGFGWVTGGGLLAICAARWRSWRRIVRAGIPGVGTVTGVEPASEGEQWVTIEYRVGERTHELRVFSLRYEVGDRVPLLIDPAAPDEALVRSSKSFHGFALAVGFLLGVSLILLGAGALAGQFAG
jgi:Protein of unknown function (DUF3592)